MSPAEVEVTIGHLNENWNVLSTCTIHRLSPDCWVWYFWKCIPFLASESNIFPLSNWIHESLRKLLPTQNQTDYIRFDRRNRFDSKFCQLNGTELFSPVQSIQAETIKQKLEIWICHQKNGIPNLSQYLKHRNHFQINRFPSHIRSSYNEEVVLAVGNL